ncbi:MAG: protein phosphatase CheZ [Micropepsaceae bacterium]
MQALKLDQSDDYFDALEKAVRGTPRGNAFLNEFAHRVRANDTDRVLGAIEALRGSIAESITASSLDVLRRELETMASSIAQTRKEIASIKPEGPDGNRIVTATEELDFVVKSTERATADILTAVERVLAIAGELKAKGITDPLCDELETLGTSMMMACSFQDLTGQRMSKVVNTLRYLETRVNAMIDIWGITAEDAEKLVDKPVENRPDAHLLNGPARDGEGVAQDDVDRLLNSATGEQDEVLAMPNGAASQDDIDALFK